MKTIKIPNKANRLNKTSNSCIRFLKKRGSIILVQKEVVAIPTKQTAAVDIFADKKKSTQWAANRNPTILVFNKERRELNTKDRFNAKRTMTNPFPGPAMVTCEPPNKATTIPPATAAIIPESGGASEAMASPKPKGKAISETTKPAKTF